MVNADVVEGAPTIEDEIPGPYAREALAATAPSTTRTRKGLPSACAPTEACSTFLSYTRRIGCLFVVKMGKEGSMYRVLVLKYIHCSTLSI